MKVYTANINSDFSCLYEWVKSEAEKFKNPKRQKEYIAGRFLVIKALKDWGINGDIVFKYAENGKLYVDDAPCFNISHDGDIAICACSEFDVGADVVKIDRFSEKIPAKMFTGEEQKILGDNTVKIALLWSLKEAHSKMKGEGIAKTSKLMDFSGLIADDTFPQNVLYNGAYFYSVKQEEYVITVCSEKPVKPEFIFVI